ncbi:MAG: hypothetical protein JWO80_4638 [Bryobacterales bacterium]|nr:hypothetical protein [Bryobacterales bacterium]
MAGYLDQYGAGEDKREAIIKRLVLGAVLVVVFGGLGYYLFKNYAQIRKVDRFLALVRNKDYQGAYQAWGCTPQTPCPSYSFQKFMEDWGPPATSGNVRVSDAESCNAGVIITVDLNTERKEQLWVQKNSSALSFSPYPSCPGKSPLSNMIHQTVGKLRKPFLN